ncbi:MAG: hypothetical protein SGILL_008295 [Bacillariaceae sp.]
MMNSEGQSGSRDTSTSSALAKNSEGYSAPSESNVATGRHKLNESLRSIVMSRTAFSLFHGFNPVPTNVYSICDNAAGSIGPAPYNRPDFTNVPTGEGEDYNQLLLNSLNKSTNEVAITKDMGSRLRRVLDEKHQNKKLTTFVEAEIPMGGNKRKSPRLDVACGGKLSGSLSGFVEVGLTPKDTSHHSEAQQIDWLFWNKINQAIDYLHLLTKMGVKGKDENKEEFKLHVAEQKTLLLCVIVTNRARNFGRIAIFACEPKKNGHWRMALMWRKEGRIIDISRGFGLYIAAIQFLTEKDFDLSVDGEKWNYMGPNCSKVTVDAHNAEKSHSYVLRAYDNRVRQTSRSPFLYHNWNKIKGDTKVVVQWNEGNNSDTIEFRDEDYSQQSTIFRSDGKCGKVEVISVPFIPGQHTCSNVKEALQLTRFLKAMHADGYVQGDIRGLNAVFAGEETALIDHDFGGREGEVKFPPGYETALPDGRREIGTETVVSQSLDVEALRWILAHLHEFEEENLPADAFLAFYKLRTADSLQKIEKALLSLDADLIVKPTTEYSRFMAKLHPSTRDEREKQTVQGDAVTPSKMVTLPSKRSAPSARASNGVDAGDDSDDEDDDEEEENKGEDTPMPSMPAIGIPG